MPLLVDVKKAMGLDPGSDPDWWDNFGLLQEYVAAFRRWPPPDCVYRTVAIGAWARIAWRRTGVQNLALRAIFPAQEVATTEELKEMYRYGLLTASQRELLSRLPGWENIAAGAAPVTFPTHDWPHENQRPRLDELPFYITDADIEMLCAILFKDTCADDELEEVESFTEHDETDYSKYYE
jgi:hypothetical protein